MKKRIAIISAALLICAQLAGCAGAPAESDGADTTGAQSAADTVESTEPVVNWESSGLPKIDYEGDTFTFLQVDEGMLQYAWRHIDIDTQNGEILNDAIYNRNKKIEELYNINIDVVYTENDADFQNAITKSVSAEDKAYDALFGYAHTLLTVSQEGQLVNFYDMPYINTDEVWWDSSAVEGLTVAGKLYMCAGDISPLTNARVYSLVFNKDMCTQLNLEFPYKYVLDGTWTIEVFNRYITDVNYDVDGNSEMNYDDRWGFLSQKGNSWMMYFSGGGRIVEKDGDGNWSVSFTSDRNVSLAMESLAVSTDTTKTLMADDYVANNGGSWAAASSWFASGGSFMRSSVFEPVPRDYRSMKTDFGVLPYPKLDENQDRYYTCPEHTSRMIAFPATCDRKYSGIIVESLAAESVSTVSEAFYDVCLNEKAVRDDESKQILKIIFDSKVFDLGYILDFGGFRANLSSLEAAGNTEAASSFAKIQTKAQNELDKFLAKYEG